MRRGCTVRLTLVSMLSVAATACGSGSAPAGSQSNDIAILAAASERTRAITSAVSMVATLTDGGQEYVLTLRGSFDFAADTGSFVITFPGGAISRTEELFTASSLYFRLPADPSQPEQLIWVRVPRAEARVRYLLRPPGNDPEYVLAQLPNARSVRLVGSEQVGGVAMTHYQGFLDLQTVTADFDPSRRDQVAQLQNVWPDQGAPIDVWLDEPGTVRRVVQTLNLGGVATRLQLDLTPPGDAVQAHPQEPATSVEGRLQGILMG